MKIQTLFSVVMYLFLGFSAWAQKTIVDANAEARTVEKFNAISISHAFDVYLTQSNETALAVSASDEATLRQIVTEVRNGTLYIGLTKGFIVRSNKKLKAYIAATDLNRIILSGACDLRVEGVLNTPDLEIIISGASDFYGNLLCQNLKLESSGSSDFHIQGKTENTRIQLSGSSDMKGIDLQTDYCDINCSGTSDVEITVHKEMNVNLSGASNVTYKGNGIIRGVNTSGSSSLRKRE